MAKKKQQGHATAPPADPFEMTPQQFDAALEGAVDGDSAGETPAGEQAGDTGPQPGEQTPPDRTPDPDGPIDLTIPTAEPEPGGADGDGEDEVYEIVHHGHVHRVTKEKLINLAQKGFDYEQKVGPHRRIVQLVESDPRAAALLDSYVRGELTVPGANMSPAGPPAPGQPGAHVPGANPPAANMPAANMPPANMPPAGPAAWPAIPELKPLARYESETEWLKDNIQVLLPYLLSAASAPPAGAASPPPAHPGANMPGANVPGTSPADVNPPGPAVDPAVITADTVLASRDPYGYPVIKTELDAYARRLLTAEQYALVNSGDIPALIRFYDQVRPRILRDKGISLPPPGSAAGGTVAGGNAAAANPPGNGAAPRGNPPFRAKPGGGTPPREDGGELSHAWEKNDEEFQRILARAKGYE